MGSRARASSSNGEAFDYVLRWKPSELINLEESPAILSGYGAALDLKKVDYLVIDDRKLKATSSEDGNHTIKTPEGFEKDQDEKCRIWFEEEMLRGGSGKRKEDSIEDRLNTLSNSELASEFHKIRSSLTFHCSLLNQSSFLIYSPVFLDTSLKQS